MRIDIVAIGKLKKDFYKTAFEYYLKRARKYFKIDLVEKKSRSGQTPKREREQLSGKLNDRTFAIVLDENGEEFSTSMLAELMERLQSRGLRSLAFFVGGPLGLDDEFKSLADMRIALSRMTLTHELARVVLIEQIYRCGTILAGEKYHK